MPSALKRLHRQARRVHDRAGAAVIALAEELDGTLAKRDMDVKYLWEVFSVGRGADRPRPAEAASAWAAPHNRSGRGDERHPLRSGNRLPVARPPKEFPPCQTVQGYFYHWRRDGIWHLLNDMTSFKTRL